jgi:hypothetical protein
LAKDKKVLDKVEMKRFCATYTLTHGVAAAFKDEIREKLQNGYYSLDIYESTNNNMDKILNILFRFFDEEDQQLRTVHFAARIVNQATAENVLAALLEALADPDVRDDGVKLDIPPERMISCLMDNCATMRGVGGGVETLLRKGKVPYLLDISGDIVHMIMNSSKELCRPFENYLETISSDIFYNLQKSPKAKDLFSEIQILLGRETPLQIVRPCPSRFLQMLEVANRLADLEDALRMYYYAFLTEEQLQYK